MTKADMMLLLNRITTQLQKVRESGQQEYAHDENNAFANFERVAKELGLKREQVLLVYLRKHLDGITAYVGGHKSQREAVTGRILDAIMYLALLWGMIEESDGAQAHMYELPQSSSGTTSGVNTAHQERLKGNLEVALLKELGGGIPEIRYCLNIEPRTNNPATCAKQEGHEGLHQSVGGHRWA